jgi:calcineurin-like phosphoesterase family protein
MIKHSNGDNIFFISDTHFNHANVLKFCNRPFSTVEEMNEYIIKQWNDKVPSDGIVYHLGDFGFGHNKKLLQILKQLNGEIHLIVGNHDRNQLKNKSFANSFASCNMQRYIYIEEQPIYLNHCPFLCFDGIYRKVKTWQLFGHVHSGPNSTIGLDIPRLDNLFPTQYDVGVDNNNFTPISFIELKYIINNKLKGGL